MYYCSTVFKLRSVESSQLLGAFQINISYKGNIKKYILRHHSLYFISSWNRNRPSKSQVCFHIINNISPFTVSSQIMESVNYIHSRRRLLKFKQTVRMAKQTFYFLVLKEKKVFERGKIFVQTSLEAFLNIQYFPFHP